MQWNIRPIEETELETWYTVVTGAEGRDLIADELKYGGLGVHLDRTLAAFDDGDMVGTAHDEVLDMTVPGATSEVWPGRVCRHHADSSPAGNTYGFDETAT